MLFLNFEIVFFSLLINLEDEQSQLIQGSVKCILGVGDYESVWHILKYKNMTFADVNVEVV